MPMTWETNIDRAYRIGMYMLSNKKIFDDSFNMIIELKDRCNDILEKSNDSKVKKYVEDFQTVLSKFDEKNKLIETGKKYNMGNGWIFDQLLKLSKANEDHNVKKQKSKILLDKISFYESSIIQINEILNFAKEKLIIEDKRKKLNEVETLNFLKLILMQTRDYNISKLKRAAKKFQQSKALKDFKFGRMNPKLAHLLSKNFKSDGTDLPKYTIVNKEDKTERYELKTPFGEVYIGSGKHGNGRIISLKKDKEDAPNYDDICGKLDKYFCYSKDGGYAENYNDLKEAKEKIINSIINYLKQELTDEQQMKIKNSNDDVSKILNTIKPCNSLYKFKDDNDKDFASVLCGILMLSESHEFRNPTGGKFERKAMQNVLKLAEDGCTNPFSVVFNRKKGRYLPAHSNKVTNEEFGGQTQTAVILKKKILMSKILKKEFDTKVLRSYINNWLFDYAKKSNEYLRKLEPNLKINLCENNNYTIKKDTKDAFKPKNKEKAEKIEQAIKYLSIIMYNNSDFYLEIDKLPDIPGGSEVVEFKKDLLKQKNVDRINKLMNCSTKSTKN